MHSSHLFSVVVLLSNLVISVSSSPLIAKGTASTCSTNDIAIVKRTASKPAYFCSWWNSDIRTRSPFFELTVAQVNNACKCISPSPKTTSKNKRAEHTANSILLRRQSVASCRAEMSVQFTEPNHFCNFFNAYPRTTSPFQKYSAKDLTKLCNCVQGKSVSSTTKKTSTNKTSSTKAVIKTTSSPKTSTSKKTSSQTSTKTTSKKTSSSLKQMSTPKISSSVFKETTGSKKTSSVITNKVSTIQTKILPTSSHKSSSSKSSAAVSSPGKSSAAISSSKMSSSASDRVSASVTPISTDASSSPAVSFTTSEVAAPQPTIRTDGQFYLRIANTTAPPNDYYVTIGDGYDFGTTSKSLFEIDRNGYLYDTSGRGFWPEFRSKYGTNNSMGSGYVNGYPDLASSPNAANLKCTYDENYLLSCVSVFADGTYPSNFMYQKFQTPGGYVYYEWSAGYKTDTLQTMDLYVELKVFTTTTTTAPTTSSTQSPVTESSTLTNAVDSSATSSTDSAIVTSSTTVSDSPSISSTTSPASSSTVDTPTTSSTDSATVASSATIDTSSSSISTSPSATPTCNLVPYIPNAGFEDGTSQTAWTTTVSSYGSWSPSTINPNNGAWDGQLSFPVPGQGVIGTTAYVKVTNTLENLCPGFSYSISYASLCGSQANCYITVQSTEAGSSSSSTTKPGSGWLTIDDALKFRAASDTSILTMFVITEARSSGDGYIYLDDVSIALSSDV